MFISLVAGHHLKFYIWWMSKTYFSLWKFHSFWLAQWTNKVEYLEAVWFFQKRPSYFIQVNLQVVTINWRTDNYNWSTTNGQFSWTLIIQTSIILIQPVNKINIQFLSAVSFVVISVHVEAAPWLTCKSELVEKLPHIILHSLNDLISKMFAIEKEKVISTYFV